MSQTAEEIARDWDNAKKVGVLIDNEIKKAYKGACSKPQNEGLKLLQLLKSAMRKPLQLRKTKELIATCKLNVQDAINERFQGALEILPEILEDEDLADLKKLALAKIRSNAKKLFGSRDFQELPLEAIREIFKEDLSATEAEILTATRNWAQFQIHHRIQEFPGGDKNVKIPLEDVTKEICAAIKDIIPIPRSLWTLDEFITMLNNNQGAECEVIQEQQVEEDSAEVLVKEEIDLDDENTDFPATNNNVENMKREAEEDGGSSERENTGKYRLSATKRKYEPLKVLPKSSLPLSEPFVSLQPLTPSQILNYLPQKKSHKGNDLKCPTNSPKFKTASKANVCKSDARPFDCPHCPYAAKNKTTFSSHIRSRHPATEEEASANPFKCPECPKAFRLKDYLSKHIRYIHKKTDENFICDSCPYVGRNKIQLQHHFNHRHKKPSLFCYFCPYKARRMPDLTKHLRAHTEERPFNCPYCIYTSTRASTMKRHVKKIHKKDEGSSKFQFQYSKSSPFPTQNSSTDLSRNEHKTEGERLYKCPHCSYAAVLKQRLRRHIQAKHPKEGEEDHRPFTCTECPKTFRFKDRLSAHILRMHGNLERTFLCDSCPYLGTTHSALRQHIKNQHTDPIFTCYFCPWMGKQFDKVVIHMGIHTGERPYKCPHCIFTTTRPHTLKIHVKIIHGNEEGSFQCQKCSCKLKTLTWLKRHQQLHDGSAYKFGEFGRC